MQYLEARNQLLQALDKAINEGHWEASLFYKNILKQLKTLQEDLLAKFEGEESVAGITEDTKAATIADMKQKEGYEKVYISLYQTDGERVESWASTVMSLVEHYVGRPIYRKFEHLEEMIRVKSSRSEAYVVVWVKQADILPPQSGLQLCDRFGHELLNLRAGSIRLENIIEFVHDGSRYNLFNNHLLPQ